MTGGGATSCDRAVAAPLPGAVVSGRPLVPLRGSVERWLPAAALSLALLLPLFSPSPDALAAWPFLISLVLFGLPHGAADGLLLFRSRHGSERASLALRYLGLLLLAGAILAVAPAAAVILFLALSMLHFGGADAAHDLPRRASDRSRRLWAVARGGLLVGLPFALYPDAAWAPFGRLTSTLGSVASLGSPALRVGGLAVVLAALGSLLLYLRSARDDGPRAEAWVETGLIVALCTTTPPLYAVGVYFLVVHGFRQSAELGAKLAPAGAGEQSLGSRLVRTHLAALPLLVPSLAILTLAALSLGIREPIDLAATSLGLYIAGTLPHHWLHAEPPRG
jgi:Brp/Blh family beta-carotene 15,15'-monooxygenase